MNYGEKEATSRDLELCKVLLNAGKVARGSWEEIANLVVPEIISAADLKATPDVDKSRVCGYARHDVFQLTSAHVNYITPMGQRWFQYAPWTKANDDNEEWASKDSWFSRVTEIAQEAIERSNFYTEELSCFLDRVTTGTGLLFCDPTEDGELYFAHVPAGTYGLAENNFHEVDTVCRMMKMSPAQILQEFDGVNLPDDIRKEFEDVNSRYKVNRLIYHLVEPRPNAVQASNTLNAIDMPWRSVYIDVNSQKVLSESGYYEFPFVATRFVRCGSQVFGRSALAGVVQDIKDLMDLKHFLRVSAEQKVYPPMLISADLVGQVDLRAGGKTIIDRQDASLNLPKPLLPANDIREALQHIEELKGNIDDATFVSVMKTVSNVDRAMTATEVNARQSESIMTFTQSFTQHVADFKPMMARIFAILWRAGKFPKAGAPRDLVEYFTDENQVIREKVSAPNLLYVGRMAQALNYSQQSSLNNTVSELVQLTQATQNDEFLLPIDITSMVRWKLNSAGVPQKCLRENDDVKRILQMRQKQQEAAMNAQLAEQESAAARNMAQAEQ